MKTPKKWVAPLVLALALAAVLAVAKNVSSVADNKKLSKVTFVVS